MIEVQVTKFVLVNGDVPQNFAHPTTCVVPASLVSWTVNLAQTFHTPVHSKVTSVITIEVVLAIREG